MSLKDTSLLKKAGSATTMAGWRTIGGDAARSGAAYFSANMDEAGRQGLVDGSGVGVARLG
jgi:hypothetical protein